MVLVRFEYLRSDSERKYADWPIQLDTCQIRKPRHVRKPSSVPTGREGMFICSKLGHNLSEMEVRTFVRIQRVIWDHLMAFRAEIIQKQALFPKNNYELQLINAVCCVFFFRSRF